MINNNKNHFELDSLPSISIIIPTLNCSGCLELCLESINKQQYPKQLIEILIIDGGSADSTLDVAKKYTDKIFLNPLKTAEAGKAVGVKNANNEIIALIDSDNILPNEQWLLEMIFPLVEDKSIIGSEPIKYTYRRSDGIITRYCALIGMNDVLCLFLGNYDRYCYLTNRWTGIDVKSEDKEKYLKLDFGPEDINKIPTIGANGTLFRKDFVDDLDIGDYLFDIDLLVSRILKTGEPIFFAKVKNGIIHIFSGNLKSFMKKQKRRIVDYKKYQKLRSYNWTSINKKGLIRFIFYTLLILPILGQSIKGFFKVRDVAWFFHYIACLLTLSVYSYNFILQRFFRNK